MSDYEAAYEEFRQEIMNSSHLMEQLRTQYKKDLLDSKDSSNLDHAITKIIIYVGTAVFLFGNGISGLRDANSLRSSLIFALLMILGAASALMCASTVSSLKKMFGNTYFRYDYDNIIDKFVQDRKANELNALLTSISRRVSRLEDDADIPFTADDVEERHNNFCYFLQLNPRLSHLVNQIEKLHRYDQFARDLKYDYIFSKKIHDSIHGKQ